MSSHGHSVPPILAKHCKSGWQYRMRVHIGDQWADHVLHNHAHNRCKRSSAHISLHGAMLWCIWQTINGRNRDRNFLPDLRVMQWNVLSIFSTDSPNEHLSTSFGHNSDRVCEKTGGESGGSLSKGIGRVKYRKRTTVPTTSNLPKPYFIPRIGSS